MPTPCSVLLSSCSQRIFLFLGHSSPRELGHSTCKSLASHLALSCFPPPGRWQSVASALCVVLVVFAISWPLPLCCPQAQHSAGHREGTDDTGSAACKVSRLGLYLSLWLLNGLLSTSLRRPKHALPPHLCGLQLLPVRYWGIDNSVYWAHTAAHALAREVSGMNCSGLGCSHSEAPIARCLSRSHLSSQCGISPEPSRQWALPFLFVWARLLGKT